MPWESPSSTLNFVMLTAMYYARVNATMASAELKYRSVKFYCADNVKDFDIVRALMVQCDTEDIERVQPMPGSWFF